MKDIIWVMEKLVRIHDQLDEQLHAGFFFYIFTGAYKFISNAVSIWPMVLVLLGLSVPEILYDSLRSTQKARERAQGGEMVAIQ